MYRKKALWLSGLTALVVLGTAMFQWLMIDWLTPFLFPFLFQALLYLFIFSLIVSLLKAVKAAKQEKLSSTLPLAINALTAAMIWFVPFTSLWLEFDFHYHLQERMAIVDMVHQKVLKPGQDSDLVQLPPGYANLSRGGNEIVILPAKPSFLVFFFTFRGILDNYSGFVYVPAGHQPEFFGQWRGDSFFEIRPMAPNWFYVASR